MAKDCQRVAPSGGRRLEGHSELQARRSVLGGAEYDEHTDALTCSSHKRKQSQAGRVSRYNDVLVFSLDTAEGHCVVLAIPAHRQPALVDVDQLMRFDAEILDQPLERVAEIHDLRLHFGRTTSVGHKLSFAELEEVLVALQEAIQPTQKSFLVMLAFSRALVSAAATAAISWSSLSARLPCDFSRPWPIRRRAEFRVENGMPCRAACFLVSSPKDGHGRVSRIARNSEITF